MTDKNISQDDRLKALALFVQANSLYAEARKYEAALNRHLGTENGDHITNAVYSDSIASVADFDEALRRDGISVEAANG